MTEINLTAGAVQRERLKCSASEISGDMLELQELITGIKRQEGMEDFLAQKRAALGAVAAAFHLEPADPWKPVKALQAAFDPSGLVFSDTYYDVLGLENPRDAGKSRQERLGEFETVVFSCANGEEE